MSHLTEYSLGTILLIDPPQLAATAKLINN